MAKTTGFIKFPLIISQDIEDDDIALEYDDQLDLVYFPRPSNLISRFEADNQFVRTNVPVHIQDNDSKLNIVYVYDIYCVYGGYGHKGGIRSLLPHTSSVAVEHP